MDASLHAAPEMTPVLLRMKEDILNNRPVADIFWETVRPDGVGIARSMFGRFDRLQEKDAANKYSRQIDDVDELLERKDALQELSDSYRIYTAASDEADTDRS